MRRGKDQWARLKEIVQDIDVIIEVVDARDMEGTRLYAAERMGGTNRIILVANKSDLLPAGNLPRIPRKGIRMNARSTDPNERKKLLEEIFRKTKKRPIRALFIGYPNVGKSSLINMLARKQAARVSDVAGTTRNPQWVKIGDNLMVTDYRGLYPEKEEKTSLVRKGALNVQGDEETYADGFAMRVLGSAKLRKWLEERFDMDLSGANDSEKVLEAIARRRKWFLKGGELNLQEAARALVRAMREAPEI